MNNLKNFVTDCVEHFARCARIDGFYTLNVLDLPDFVQHEFAALIMSHNESSASEATGPDNENWDSIMLPALIKYLSNSIDKDEQIEFNSTWRDCVTKHFFNQMQELIDNALIDLNSDHGYIRSPNYYYGVQAHG